MRTLRTASRGQRALSILQRQRSQWAGGLSNHTACYPPLQGRTAIHYPPSPPSLSQALQTSAEQGYHHPLIFLTFSHWSNQLKLEPRWEGTGGWNRSPCPEYSLPDGHVLSPHPTRSLLRSPLLKEALATRDSCRLHPQPPNSFSSILSIPEHLEQCPAHSRMNEKIFIQ